MMRRIVWISIGLVLIVTAITAGWTQTRRWRGGRGAIWFRHGPASCVAHDLGLTETQKLQIQSIWNGERPNIAELIHEFASEQREMDALTFQGTPDERRIQDVATRQSVTLAKLITEKEKLTSKIYSQVLNSAQRPQADKLLKQWSSHLDHFANRIGNTSGEK
jgi:Spy/CpxP family protein refolding chaperone